MILSKRNYFFLFVFLGSVIQANAQLDTFIVKSLHSNVSVLPVKSFLFLKEDNLFKIKYVGKNKLGRMELRGGVIDKKNDSIYNFKAQTGVSAILVIYEKLKNGNEIIAFTYTYKLFGREMPHVRLDGIPNDSVIGVLTVIALGKLRAQAKYNKDIYTVTSFKLYVGSGNLFDTLSTKGNQLSLDMKRLINKIDVKTYGGALMFEEIKGLGPGGVEITFPPLKVFLMEEKISGFGF